MKKQKFLTAGTILLALTCAVLLAIPALRARAQSGGILDVLEQTRQAQAQALEGAWTYTVTPVVPPSVPQPPSQRAYITVARGGGITVYIRTAPGETSYGEQHGVWEH